jgi:hypothetical protein
MGTLIADKFSPGILDHHRGLDRLQVPTDRPAPRPGPAGEPVGARRRPAGTRLRHPRHLRRQVHLPQLPAVGLPAPRSARRGGCRRPARSAGRPRGQSRLTAIGAG